MLIVARCSAVLLTGLRLRGGAAQRLCPSNACPMSSSVVLSRELTIALVGDSTGQSMREQQKDRCLRGVWRRRHPVRILCESIVPQNTFFYTCTRNGHGIEFYCCVSPLFLQDCNGNRDQARRKSAEHSSTLNTMHSTSFYL